MDTKHSVEKENNIENSIDNNTKQKSKYLDEKVIRKYHLMVIIIPIIIVIIIACAYFENYYRADAMMMKDISMADGLAKYAAAGIDIELNDNEVYFLPAEFSGNENVGIIFYPGAKVQKEAYFPLGLEMAKKGYAVIIPGMPANFSLFNIYAAKDYIEDTDRFSYIDKWYLAGHSLGGVCAGKVIERYPDKYEGLILLASYVTDDISNYGDKVKILSIYGSEDKVLSIEQYEKNKSNLCNLTEKVIKGGNHGYFGNYGEQKGDGIASISREEQIEETANAVDDFIKNIKVK